jgi:hypothetical protein
MQSGWEESLLFICIPNVKRMYSKRHFITAASFGDSIDVVLIERLGGDFNRFDIKSKEVTFS